MDSASPCRSSVGRVGGSDCSSAGSSAQSFRWPDRRAPSASRTASNRQARADFNDVVPFRLPACARFSQSGSGRAGSFCPSSFLADSMRGDHITQGRQVINLHDVCTSTAAKRIAESTRTGLHNPCQQCQTRCHDRETCAQTAGQA